MRGVDIVYPVLVYNGIEAVDERGVIDKRHVLHAVFKHELRVACHACRAEEPHKLAEFERVVYFQRDLRPRRKHQHIFHFTHALPSFAAAPPERRSFFAIASI